MSKQTVAKMTLTAEDLEEAKNYKANQIDLALWAGYMLGLASLTSREFDERDRLLFARMSFYLRRKANLK